MSLQRISQIDAAVVPMTLAMQRRGMLVDRDGLDKLRDRFESEQSESTLTIRLLASRPDMTRSTREYLERIAHDESLARSKPAKRALALLAAHDKKPGTDLVKLWNHAKNDSNRLEVEPRFGSIPYSRISEINPGSRDQLSQLLFDSEQHGGLGLTPRGLTNSQKRFKVDDGVLEGLKHLHPIIPAILDYNELDKLLGTYIRPLYGLIRSDGRIHPQLKMTRVPTGRFACANPNLLAIPTRSERGKLIRYLFIAPPGRRIVAADLSQIEICVVADLANDRAMIDAICNAEWDIHTQTASAVYGVACRDVTKDQRTMAKNATFLILYLGTYRGLTEQIIERGGKLRYKQTMLKELQEREYQQIMMRENNDGVWLPANDDDISDPTANLMSVRSRTDGFAEQVASSRGLDISDDKIIARIEKDCQEIIVEWFKLYHGVAAWIEYAKQSIRRDGYAETKLGRRVYCEGANSTIKRVAEACLRTGVNHFVQGGACEIFKMAMADCGSAGYSALDWRPSPELYDRASGGAQPDPLLPTHDELAWEADENQANHVGWSLMRIMRRVGEKLKLKVPVSSKASVASSLGALKLDESELKEPK